MGQRKRKREAFLAAHPICCFCGGQRLATTIDHVPNRASFMSRLGPEGYEFPACEPCQTATRLDEIAFSFLVYLTRGDDNHDAEQFRRLLSGIKNNLPELMPNLRLSANDKRRRLAKLGLEKPLGLPLADLPLAGIPTGYHKRMERYVHKIILALHYRIVGTIASKEMRLFGSWTTGQDRRMDDVVSSWSEMTPIVEVGRRRNVNIGDAFRVRTNYSEEMQAFVAVGQFRRGLIFLGSCLEKDIAKRTSPTGSLDDLRVPGEWVPLSRDTKE